MSKLTQRERKLFIGFCALFALVVGGGLTVIGIRFGVGIHQENGRLSAKIDGLNEDLLAKPEWERREVWLEELTQVYDSREIASAHLLDLVNGSVQEFDLEPSGRELVEVPVEQEGDEGSYFESSSVRIVVSGKEEQIFRWVHSLQRPEDLLGVTGLKIEAGELLKVEAEVTMWYFEAEE